MRTVAQRTQFLPAETWFDDGDEPINAHSGALLVHNGVFYWFGEHKVEGEIGNSAQVGANVCTATDLHNWTDDGMALAVSADPAGDVVRGCIIECPHVGVPQLFDVQDDLLETVDRSIEPELDRRVRELRERMMHGLQAQGYAGS
jgi:hypothetical protein